MTNIDNDNVLKKIKLGYKPYFTHYSFYNKYILL